MKDVFNNIDELILTKSYTDLSPDELIAISELAANESDFNQLKATMLAVQKQISSEATIEARPETKAALMREFKSARPAVIANSSKMGLGFFFPKGKPLAQMPGLQILTAAACLLMVFTVLRNIDINGTDKKVAYEESSKELPKTNAPEKTNSAVVTQEKTEAGKDFAVDETNEVPITERATEQEEITEIESANKLAESTDQLLTATDDKISSGATTGKFVMPTVAPVIAESAALVEADEMDLVSEVTMEDVAETDEEVAFEKEAPIRDEFAMSRATSSVGAAKIELADASMDGDSKAFKKKADQTQIKLSRTLEEDAELIDLFYTAM